MKILRRLLILVLILVVLVAIAPMFLSGWIADKAAENISDSMGAPTSIGQFDFGWMSGVQIADLKIEASDQNPTAVSVKKIDVKPELGALLSGDFICRDFLVDGVEIHHREAAAAEGGAGEDGDTTSSSESDESGGSERTELPGIDLKAEVRNVTIIYETADGQISELRSIDSTTLEVKTGEVATFRTGFQGLDIDVSAEVFDGNALREQPKAKVRIAADDFDLAKLEAAVKPWMARLAGRLTIDEVIEVDGPHINAAGKISVKNLVTDAAATATPGSLDINHDFEIAPEDKDVMIKTFDLRSSFGTAKAEGHIDLDEAVAEAEGLTFDGNFDLAKLSDFLGDLAPVRVSGQMTAKGRAQHSGTMTRADFRVEVADLAARDEAGETTRLGRVTMDNVLSWDGETSTLAIEKSVTDSRAAKATISGTLAMPEDGSMSGPLKIELDSNLDELGVFARALSDRSVGGRVTAKGDVILGDGQRVDLEFNGRRVTASGFGEDGSGVLGPIDFGGEAHGTSEDDTLVFSKLTFRTDGIEFDGSGTRYFVGPDGAATASVPVKTLLDFGRMGALIRPFQPDMTLAGTADIGGNVEMQGSTTRATLKGTMQRMSARGGSLGERTFRSPKTTLDIQATVTEEGTSVDSLVAKLMGAVIQSTDVTYTADSEANMRYAPSGTFDITAVSRNARIQRPGGAAKRIPSALNFSAKGRTTNAAQVVDSLSVTSDGLAVNGNARLVTNGLSEVKAKGDLDLDKLSNSWLPLFLDGASGSGQGKLDVDMRYPQGTSRAVGNGRAELRMDALSYAGAQVTDAAFVVDMKDGVATITEGSSKLNNGTIALTGTVDTRNEAPDFDVAMDAKKIELVREWQPWVARVIPIFSGLKATAHTFISAELAVNGRGSTWEEMSKVLNGKGSFDCDAGTIQSPLMGTLLQIIGKGPDLPFDGIQTQFEIKDGAVHQDSMYVDAAIAEVRLGGITGLDGSLKYDLGVKPKGSTPPQYDRFISFLDPEGYLPLGLSGTVDAPKLDLPDPATLIGGTIEGAARGAIGNILGGGGEKGDAKNPLGGIGNLIGGGKDEKKDGEKADPGKKVLEGLGGLLGGNKNKKNDDQKSDDKKKKKNPLGGLGGLLGGGN